jgi:hypothetical protein
VWFLSILLVILFIAVLIGFALANATTMLPQIVIWEWGRSLVLENVSFVVVVLIALLAGAVLVLMTGLVREVEVRRRLRAAERRRFELEQELAAMRHLPFEEPLPGSGRTHAAD